MSKRWSLLVLCFIALACDADEGATSDAAVADAGATSGGNGGMGAGGAGGGGGGVACPDRGTAQECADIGPLLFGFCVLSDDVDAFDGGLSAVNDKDSADIQLSGTVESTDVGPASCGVGYFGISGAGTHSFVLVDGELEIKVLVKLPAELELLEVGDRVRVAFQRESVGWFNEGPPRAGRLELRDDAGDLLLWMAQSSAGVDQLAKPPELALEDGAASCVQPQTQSPCPALRRSFSFEMDGDEVDVPYRQTRNLSNYVAMHGENVEGSQNRASRHVFAGIVRGTL